VRKGDPHATIHPAAGAVLLSQAYDCDDAERFAIDGRRRWRCSCWGWTRPS